MSKPKPQASLDRRRDAEAELCLPDWQGRSRVLLAVFLVVGVLLAGQAFRLQIVDADFLVAEAAQRQQQVLKRAQPRRMIADRNGEPLAVSAPTASIWANPKRMLEHKVPWAALAAAMGRDEAGLREFVTQRASRQFLHLKRHLVPAEARSVRALKLPGVYVAGEHQRFYPMGEVTAHLIGFTNIDDRGQEGVERSFDGLLTTAVRSQRVRRDRRGKVIEVMSPRTAADDQALHLSIDRRVQYVAYRELKAAVQAHGAKGGSMVVVDVTTGDLLAMVNQPSYNPHQRHGINWQAVRNRAVTDVFEPGSIMKPLIIAAALQGRAFSENSIVDTSPGRWRVDSLTVRDFRDYGELNLTGIVRKSSNVGVSKIGLAMPREQLFGFLSGVGFGMPTAAGLPGEQGGRLRHFTEWSRVGQATLAYGYGVSVNTLQLAQAYATLGADGLRRPLRITADDGGLPAELVMRPEVARSVRAMMEAVVAEGGTGRKAAIAGYRVAGKTGTVRKSGSGGYREDAYHALFAGIVPASRPRLAAIVMIDEPGGEQYYGGQVAAPVFSRVLAEALRLLNVPPDAAPDDLIEAGLQADRLPPG